MNVNLTNLVAIARKKVGTTTASSWRAVRYEGEQFVDIYHYATLMISVHDDDTIVPISRGWGSMTDKKGIRKILTNVNALGYADIYKGFGE